MRIAIACSSRELFGSDRSAVRTGDILASLGHSVTLLVPAARPENGLSEHAAQRGLAVMEAPLAIATSRKVEGAFTGWRAPRDADAYDLVIFNTTAVLPARVRARRRVLIVREWLDPRRITHRFLARIGAARADAVVGISNDVLGQWRRICGAGQTFLVPNWLNDEWFEQAQLGQKCGIVCVGRFNSWKGQDILASAYLDAFAGDSPVPLTFFGAEEHGRFARAAKELDQRSEGRWKVNPIVSDVKPIYEAAAAVAVPSLRPEPFGNVLLEALVSGCRVVAFPGGGPNDLAAALPRGAVEIVPRGKEALANWLVGWHADGSPPQDRELHTKVRSVLKRQYSRAAATETWRGILRSLAF